MRFFVTRAFRNLSSTSRERSAWPTTTLSYSGRKRTGAAASPPGRGAFGRSNSSRPRASANGTSLERIGLMISATPRNPVHA